MFKKGQSGNPAGRPKERITTNKELKNQFKEMLSENKKYLPRTYCQKCKALVFMSSIQPPFRQLKSNDYRHP
jgi:hypothetical protein